jgi:hypothetical protein
MKFDPQKFSISLMDSFSTLPSCTLLIYLLMSEGRELLGIAPGAIGAPLWVSGDRKRCAKGRREMIARVNLGEQKFVNTESPRAIAGIHCFQWGTPFEELRSFKYHNWADAKPALLKVLHAMDETDMTH